MIYIYIYIIYPSYRFPPSLPTSKVFSPPDPAQGGLGIFPKPGHGAVINLPTIWGGCSPAMEVCHPSRMLRFYFLLGGFVLILKTLKTLKFTQQQ